MKCPDNLTEVELDMLGSMLAHVQSRVIPNIEALDGFFVALACYTDMVTPSDFLPILQVAKDARDDRVFKTIQDTEIFSGLVYRFRQYVNDCVLSNDLYMPLWLKDRRGRYHGNDWARGFLAGIDLHYDIWAELIADEERGGVMVPIWALAYEHHDDPEQQPFNKPVTEALRQELLFAIAGGIIHMRTYFQDRQLCHKELVRQVCFPSGTFKHHRHKIRHNDPCPCGSGRMFRQCCGT